MRKIAGSAIASVIVAGGLVGLSGTPAFAGCAPDRGTGYTIFAKSTVYKATNLKSDWVFDKTKPTISYNENKTSTVSASGTAGVEAEAGVIFAKASTSFSVTVGGEWSKGSSWNYELPAENKPGKTKVRMVMYHEAKKFKTRKYTWTLGGNCKTTKKTKWTKTFVAPVKRNNNVWGLEYK
ncbi:hypothetical protein SGFS_045000 [Streptomyces graminofaciens]|uniref:Lipoprotein n=1 Tax=Streptomyces graminofaciens TaxID=68212 RepID=A0ABM7FB08_9ACTN|nr:hypothetical protein [Streptomyces graminofaciens]BBC33206.1 hypothetical protein SGFS_045000 [Streptomyces graminofaciens]